MSGLEERFTSTFISKLKLFRGLTEEISYSSGGSGVYAFSIDASGGFNSDKLFIPEDGIQLYYTINNTDVGISFKQVVIYRKGNLSTTTYSVDNVIIPEQAPELPVKMHKLFKEDCVFLDLLILRYVSTYRKHKVVKDFEDKMFSLNMSRDYYMQAEKADMFNKFIRYYFNTKQVKQLKIAADNFAVLFEDYNNYLKGIKVIAESEGRVPFELEWGLISSRVNEYITKMIVDDGVEGNPLKDKSIIKPYAFKAADILFKSTNQVIIDEIIEEYVNHLSQSSF